jgi:hypothetical protein
MGQARAVYVVSLATALAGCGGSPASTPSPVGDTAPPAGDGASASSPKCSTAVTKLVDLSALAGGAGVSSVGAPSFAVNDTDVYFAFGDQQTGGVYSVPIRGGAATRVAPIAGGTGWSPNSNLVLTGTRVVFVQGTSQSAQIASVPLSGGAVTVLATTQAYPFDLTTDGQDVFYSDVDGIHAVADSGGPERTVVADARVAGGIGADEMIVSGSDLLIAGVNDAGTGGAIYRVPTAGGSLSTVATSVWFVGHPVLCGPDVCWWNALGPPPTGSQDGLPSGNILEQPASGPATTLLQGLTSRCRSDPDAETPGISVDGAC